MDTPIRPSKSDKKCVHENRNGKRCGCYAMINSEYCFNHSPEVTDEERLEARTKGGKTKALVIKPPDIVTEIKLNTPKQVTKFYAQLVNKVMGGEMDLRIATGIGYLLNGLLKSMELSEIEERLNKLESNVNQNQINYE